MNKQRLCYGPFCYPNKIKHNVEELKSFTPSGNLYCEKCYSFLDKENKIKKDFYDALEFIFGTPLPGMVNAQIKKFLKEGLTYEGMYITLKYVVHIQRMNLDVKYGIGIIKYDYQEALAYEKKTNKQVPVDYKNEVKKITITENSLKQNKPIIPEINGDDLFD